MCLCFFSASVIFFHLVLDLQEQGLFSIMSHLEIGRSRRERDQKMRQESSDRSQSTGVIEDDASNEVSVRIQEKERFVTLKYPMLTKCNHAAWVIKMKVFMMAQGVWEVIESPKTVNNCKE